MTPQASASTRSIAADPRMEIGASVAGLDAQALVERYGSPLYVYDADVIKARIRRLRDAVPSGVDIAFATKANSSPAILEVMRQSDVGADVASGGELRAAARAGVEMTQIVFTGPGKTDAELEAALAAGIHAVTIESLDELDVVISLASSACAGQGLMLRLATGGGAEGTPIIGGAGNAKFGLTDAEADEAIVRLRQASALEPDGPFRLRGFHAFGASNVLDASELVAGVARTAARAEHIARAHDLSIELLDGGGGLGIPYADSEQPLDLGVLGRGLRELMAGWAGDGPLREARLLLEPGRWLVGPAGAYLCRVTRTKVRGDRHIAITDGGIHHLLRPRLVGQDHRVVPVGAAAGRMPNATIDVVGPLCTGLDILASAVQAPAPRSGDLLAVLDAGAYGYSESMPLFLTHPTPAELVVRDGEVTLSRERIEPA